MSKKLKVPCRQAGCPVLVDAGAGYCEKHRRLHTERGDTRPSASKRGYGSVWKKEREIFLAAHPLCEECLKAGKYVKATDVDHVVPHRGDVELFWDKNNWRALCHSCHSKKTAKTDLHPVYKY